MDTRAELAARPSIEEINTRYDEMLRQIRDRIDTEFGPRSWYEALPRSWGACGGEYGGLGAVNSSSPTWAFDGNIPDGTWPQARQIVADITAAHGFATAGLQIDTPASPGEPGNHQTGGVDSGLGASYTFGTYVNTSIQVTTGCHLPTSPTPWERPATAPGDDHPTTEP
ncbi:hypothetical protein BJF78_19905 [Pseudonocardia sp. CNS-139]|nr:hypothetical protein BJF78_19905 [Pseudonocardia sp. CNS-139]